MMMDEGLKLERWEEEQLAAIARDATATVRNKMLHVRAAEAERDKEKARADAAEKRAQDVEESSKGWRGLFDLLKAELGEAIAPSDQDVVLAVRALKTRCEGAEALLARSSYEVMRKRAETAESALAERSREIDELRDAVRHERLIADGLRLERAGLIKEAASLRAQLAERDERIKSLGETQRNDGAEIRALRDRVETQKRGLAELWDDRAVLRAQLDAGKQEIAGLRRSLELSMVETRAVQAEVESLRGGSEPEEPEACSVDGCEADLSHQANGCAGCGRLLCAGHSSPIIFRPNVELPDVGVFCPECVAVLRREFTREMAGPLAALVRATINLAPYPPEVAEAVVAIVGMARDALPPEMRPTAPTSPQPQEPRVRVPSHASVASRYFEAHHHVLAMEIIRDLASLPSPSSPSSPKAGRWMCPRCAEELNVRSPVLVGEERPPLPKWTWDAEHACWLHWCLGWGGFPSDRIGDAPEVTP